jgi:hypothetical protein
VLLCGDAGLSVVMEREYNLEITVSLFREQEVHKISVTLFNHTSSYGFGGGERKNYR